jgi:hypothetical protein
MKSSTGLVPSGGTGYFPLRGRDPRRKAAAKCNSFDGVARGVLHIQSEVEVVAIPGAQFRSAHSGRLQKSHLP